MHFQSNLMSVPRSKKKTRHRYARLENLEPRLVLDGSAEFVVDLNTMPSGESAYNHAWLGSELFFAAEDDAGGVELWKSDGTAAGTVQVSDIASGSDHAFPQYLTNVNGTLFFSANDGTTGFELW